MNRNRIVGGYQHLVENGSCLVAGDSQVQLGPEEDSIYRVL